MKKRAKLYIRLNLFSLFFVVVSFISLTLAWFVYSGLSTVKTEIDVKSWYIELEQGGKKISNDIVISLDDIYPGMETIEEEINIKNLGDSNAQVKYKIKGARILNNSEDNYIASEELLSDEIEDKIAHNYPFHINISLSKSFVTAKTDVTTFKVSISWPLDSGSEELDKLDSIWGTNAYNFKLEEQNKKELDKNYQIQSPIKLDIQLTAEQYIETPDSSDIPYRLGNELLYDTKLNLRCFEEKDTCIRTNVIGNEVLHDSESNKRCYKESDTCVRTGEIDVNNKISDEVVTLLPKVNKEYSSGTFEEINNLFESQIEDWNVEARLLTVKDLINVVSKDIKDSVIVIPNASNLIIGNLKYENRSNIVIQKTIDSQGYFKFLNKFSYFYSNDCYWLANEYNEINGFAVAKIEGEEAIKIYPIPKDSICKVIPVIEAEKINLK